MNKTIKDCSASVRRIVFDEQLRGEFCERLRLYQSDSIHPRYQLKQKTIEKKDSAVLVPLVHFDGCPSIIFTHRSLLLPYHRGEICFPGGRLEEGETHVEAALRECAEEIHLDASLVKIWGSLKPVLTRDFTSSVTPIVGLIEYDNISTIRAKIEEVQTVFAAPIDELFTEHRYTNFKRGNIQYRLPVFFTSSHRIISTNVTPQKQYRIWGLTAAMLHLALRNLFPKFYHTEIDIRVPLD